MLSTLAVVLLASVGASVAAPPGYVPVPGAGYMREDCVHQVPSMVAVTEVKEGGSRRLKVQPESGEAFLAPVCEEIKGRPIRLSANLSPQSGGPLPPNYDGWLAYTAWKYDGEGGIDSFTGNFSVPDMPAEEPEVLYLFTGLQNIDWIPKVDPEPTVPFDIIQPVLQFPDGFLRQWAVRSWYVTANQGALASPPIRLDPGQTVFGNMSRTGQDSFIVTSAALGPGPMEGHTTSQSATNDRLTTQPWAYTTLECYGCDGCKTFPTEPCDFTDMVLMADGEVLKPDWQVTPKAPAKTECKETVKVISPAQQTYTFQ